MSPLDTIVGRTITPALEVSRCEIPHRHGIIKPTVRLGFPIPAPLVPLNGIFRNNYLLANEETLRRDGSTLAGRVIELHYQSVQEFTRLSPGKWDDILCLVANQRQAGYSHMVHFPFLEQTGEEPFQFDYRWIAVPDRFKDGKTPVSTIQGHENFARETDLSMAQGFLEFCHHIQVPHVTFHATNPGNFLAGTEFNEFGMRMASLARHVRDKKLNVQIAVETGGITIEQLETLHERLGLNVNLDTAHLYLDLDLLHPDWPPSKINEVIAGYFEKHHEHIPQLHLTQTPRRADAHRNLFEDGLILCNEEIIGVMQELLEKDGRTFKAMVETTFNRRDQVFTFKAAHATRYFGEGNAIINIMMGLPTAGKTSGAETLKQLIGPTIASDNVRVFIEGTMSPTEVVGERKKQLVYEELLYRVKRRIERGNPQSNIEATYSLKSRREQLFGLLEAQPSQGVYIWNFRCDRPDAYARLDQRRARRDDALAAGNPFPENILWSKAIYDSFMTPAPGKEPHTELDPLEVPAGLRDRAHVITYDTSAQRITVVNANGTLDNLTEKGIDALVKKAQQQGYQSPTVECKRF